VLGIGRFTGALEQAWTAEGAEECAEDAENDLDFDFLIPSEYGGLIGGISTAETWACRLFFSASSVLFSLRSRR
jgi:hypothetical protein